MLTYKEFIAIHPGLEEGMEAFTVDGEKLGNVVELDDDSLIIERGFFFPRDYSFRYDDIAEIVDNKVILNQNRSDVDVWKDENYTGWAEYDKLNKSENINIPLKEERLEAEKVVRQKGELRVRKVVHTEMKNFTVPISKEEIVIERRPVTGEKSIPRDTTAFKEEEIKIPIMEEEVRVVKKPVVKEEVSISKKAHTEQEKINEEIKKEELHIDRDEDQEKKKAA